MGQTLKTKIRMLFCILLVGILLVSCGAATTNVEPIDYKYKVTVELKDDTTKAELEEAFQGEVVGWHPKSNIAIVKTNIDVNDDSLSQQGLLLDIFNSVSGAVSTSSNARAITPVAQNGSSAWASGSSAWASGSSAWASGSSAWASGVMGGYFTDNKKTFENINLFETHARSKNLAEDVIVAVIDSGLDLSHPMFIDRLDEPHYWKDFIDGDSYPQDDASESDIGYGHGTAVAGVIIQAAPRVKILPIRVIGPDGTGDTEDIAAAIEYAATNGAHIINLSLGTDVKDPAIEAMLVVAQNAGIITVASAGNTGESSLLFPANVPNTSSINEDNLTEKAKNMTNVEALNNFLRESGIGDTNVIGIGSVGPSDRLSDFSSYGSTLDLVAPGEGIVTAYPDSRFISATGTSFAAPLVAGTLALALGELERVVSEDLLLGLVTSTGANVSSSNYSSIINQTGSLPRLDTFNFMSWVANWDNITAQAKPTQIVSETIIYQNYFNNGAGQLNYSDEIFSNNGNNYYEDGISHNNNSQCKSNNSCLEVRLGGKDNYAKYNMSGGYTFNFTLDKASEINLEVALRTLHTSTYESDEYVQSLIYVDDHFVGHNGNVHITKLIGGGVSTSDSGWVSVNRSLGLLAAGKHSITIGGYVNKKTYHNEQSSILIDNFKLSTVSTESVTPTIPEPAIEVGQPFGGKLTQLPGKIEVENFDLGGQGTGYFDTDPGNNGIQYNTNCRANSDVDTGWSSTGCKIGWTKKGEWLNYSVNVNQSGTYSVNVSVAAPQAGGQFQLEVDGTIVANGQVPNTGGWNNFQEVSLQAIQLTKGQHVVTLRFTNTNSNGYNGDFDYLALSLK